MADSKFALGETAGLAEYLKEARLGLTLSTSKIPNQIGSMKKRPTYVLRKWD